MSIITYKTANNIVYPAYILSSDNWWVKDGLVFLDNLILDDRNVKEDTLGKRRLYCSLRGLYPLREHVSNLAGIIKCPSQHFIDYSGRLFTYEKSIFCKLKYKVIKRIEGKTVASLLWVKDVNFPFVVKRAPKPEYLYAGIIHYKDLPWFIYEYSKEHVKDGKRKV